MTRQPRGSDAAPDPAGSGSGAGTGSQDPAAAGYADRCYRSPSAMTGGVLLLALALWLVSDAVLNGTGRTPWAALSGLLLFTPLVVAYTLRPAVFASRRRIRVRNPLRTITVPWPAVESVQAGYSSELIAEGRKFQLWAIPVSLRQRKSVQRHNARVRAGHAPSSSGFLGFGKTLPSDADRKEKRAPSDQAIDELRGLALAHGEDGESPAEPGPVEVRWAYEILVPALAGAAAVTFFLTTG